MGPTLPGSSAPSRVQLPTRRDVLRYGGALGLLAAIPACGSDDGASSTADDGPAGDQEPTRGGVLTIAQSNPASPAAPFNQALHNQVWRRAVFDTLLDYQPDGPELVPSLAESWQESDGGRVLALTLREGVQFHSGREFSGEDVTFSIEKAQDSTPALNLAWVFAGLSDLAVDGNTVTLTFDAPVSALYDALTLMPIIDRESYDGFIDGTAMVGTGPFTWASFNPNSALTLERNESYWRDGRPYLDGIEVRFLTRSEALVSAVQSGDVDLGMNLLPLDRQTVEQDQRFDVVAYETFGAALCAGANVNVEPLNRKDVRQAIHYAIDRQRINDELYLGQGKVSAAPWSPVSPAYDEQYVDAYARDLDAAKQLLADAGAEGAEIIIEGGADVSKACEIVAFNLEEIGLQANVQILEPATGQERFQERSFLGVRLGFHGWNTLTPITAIRSAAPYATENNLFNFDSDKYRALAEKLAGATADEAAAATAEITEFILDKAFCVDLVHTTNNAVNQQNLHDWSYTSWDEILWADAWKA